jgi:hypothetical protein
MVVSFFTGKAGADYSVGTRRGTAKKGATILKYVREVDFKNCDRNLQNMALIRVAACILIFRRLL